MKPRILHLEDSDIDFDLIRVWLAKGKLDGELIRAVSKEEFLEKLSLEEISVILSDYHVPSFDGVEAFEIAKNRLPHVPFIFVSGALGEERAIETLKLGATDYVLKHRLERLVPSVERALRDAAERLKLHRAQEEVERQNRRLRILVRTAEKLLTSPDPEPFMGELFESVCADLGLSGYFRFHVTDDGSSLQLGGFGGVSDRQITPLKILPMHDSFCGRVAQTGLADTVTFVQQSTNPQLAVMKSCGVRAYACVPLRSRGKVFGTLSFAANDRDQFGSDDLEVIRTVCHYVEIVHEKNSLAREAGERAERMKEEDKRKDQFLAILAHELRNPLAPLRNGLQVLKLSKTASSDAAIRSRSIMERQLAHMVRLIDDLLDISRISQNKLELRCSDVSLADIIESAIETARPHIEAEGHQFAVDCPKDEVRIYADCTRLAQVVSNLLINSAKYTPSGGRVSLNVMASSSSVTIVVADTGIGIPADYLPRIFDMFSQADRGVERSKGGLGIGLALVRALVEMHGGVVSAMSTGVGQGSAFTVQLPRTGAPNAVSVNGSMHVVSHDTCKRKILVVDDNRDSAESMAMMLELQGSEVFRAYDGEEAVRMAERYRPDLILMDVGMPKLNGLDAARAIRKTDWGGMTRIVALTGWGQDKDRERSREAGCDGHLVKPVNPEALDEVVRRLLPDSAPLWSQSTSPN